MRTCLLLAFLAIGFGSAEAHDPPNYPRALIGHVSKILPQGIIVDGISASQLHPNPGPGVDHECFAGVGGPSLVKGLRTRYRVGDKIEIMVTEGEGTMLISFDEAHEYNLEIWNMLSESLAFDVNVDWDKSPPESTTASAPSASGSPSASVPSSSSSSWNPGSIDEPVSGVHK